MDKHPTHSKTSNVVTHHTQIGKTCAFVVRPDDEEYFLDEGELLECSVCHDKDVSLMWIDAGGEDKYEDTLCKKCIIKAFDR